MARYFLLRHVYSCLTDDGAVFLDLKRHAYLGIGLAETRSIESAVAGWRHDPRATDEDTGVDRAARATLDALEEGGILTREASLGHVASLQPLPQTDSIDFHEALANRPGIRALDLARFVTACAMAKFKLRFLPLDRIVSGVKARKNRHANPSALSGDRARALAVVFRRLTPLVFSRANACLFESLALVEFLALHGHFPLWVVGVHTRPFEAHSWVQLEGTILNDTLERTREFCPLLTV
jgi:hypothetical protein